VKQPRRGAYRARRRTDFLLRSPAIIVRRGLEQLRPLEKSTIPSVLSLPPGGFQSPRSSPILGVITMLPALSPTQTVSRSDGKRSASPDCRIQWHR
jgi:hypothetical protein